MFGKKKPKEDEVPIVKQETYHPSSTEAKVRKEQVETAEPAVQDGEEILKGNVPKSVQNKIDREARAAEKAEKDIKSGKVKQKPSPKSDSRVSSPSAPIPTVATEAVAKVADTSDLKAELSVFKNVLCMIGIPMGDTFVVIKEIKTQTTRESIKWRGLTFFIDMGKIAFVRKKYPYLLYDYRYMNPVNMTNVPDVRQSASAFNKLFAKNIIAQGLAALRTQQGGFNWILATIMGVAIGYILGAFLFPHTVYIPTPVASNSTSITSTLHSTIHTTIVGGG